MMNDDSPFLHRLEKMLEYRLLVIRPRQVSASKPHVHTLVPLRIGHFCPTSLAGMPFGQSPAHVGSTHNTCRLVVQLGLYYRVVLPRS